MSRIILSRRQWLMYLGAGVGLAACDSNDPQKGFLGKMERWNDRFQRGMLDPDKQPLHFPDSKLTPDADFPVYHVADNVPIMPDGWMLRVGGLVSRPRAFSLEELMRLPRTDARIEHHCVEGWSAVADWRGVRLRDLAEVVGADPKAGYVEFRSFDEGYSSSWDRESALHKQTLLAYGMNGKPLGPDHGAPVRVYSPLKLGYKNVKYLTEVHFLDHRTGGYWEDKGYEWFAGT